jgi:hypothetical protein
MDYTLGVAPTLTLRKHVLSLEESIAARATTAADGTKLRRFKEFYDGAASWDRVERIVARVEAGPQGTDTRFVVSSLIGPSGRTVYQNIYCAGSGGPGGADGCELLRQTAACGAEAASLRDAMRMARQLTKPAAPVSPRTCVPPYTVGIQKHG